MATPVPPPAPRAADLTPEQQEAVRQFMTLTNEDEASAISLLRRCGWSVTVGVSKFFDGDDPAVPDVDSLPPPPPAPAPRSQPQRLIDLDDPLGGMEGDLLARARHAAAHDPSHPQTAAAAERTEVARRIVLPPPPPVVRPSFVAALLLAPLNLGFRVVAGLWRAVQYLLGLVPGLGAFRRMASGAAAAPRRYLTPRDAAARFRREFEEATGSKALPFAEMGYTQAYDEAKAAPKYLVLVLLAPEHDDTKSYMRDTLLHPDVVAFVNSPANNVLLWGGSVRDPEAYQVSLEHRVTKFPFLAVVCVTPREGGSTRMGTVKRIVGPVAGSHLLEQLRQVTAKYADDLAAVRAVRVANEATRNIRLEQDHAYERSLALDRERARQRQEAEHAARAREAAARRQAALAKQWRAWRTAHLAPEPPAGTTAGIVRVALKLPEALGGARVRRSFADDATVEDLYAFVECCHVAPAEEATDEAGGSSRSRSGDETPATKPEGYTHRYAFRIASMMPREVHEPAEDKTLLAAIGKAASLVVEEVDDNDDDEDDEGSGDAAQGSN